MALLMVLGSHVIFSVYGFWLPNDPRGSWSEFVGAWELFRFGGPAAKVDTRHSVAAKPHDREARMAAKQQLKYPPVCFTGQQALVVGTAFGEFVRKNHVPIWACSIMPKHVHMVIGRHRYDAEQAVTLLKGQATIALEEKRLHPMSKFPRRKGRLAKCWARGEWKVYLDSPADVCRAVKYVENNPLKECLPLQKWTFVTPFTV